MREEFASRSYVTASESPQFFGGVFREVWALLKQGVDFAPQGEPKVQAELRELAAPHMAVLVHQRSKVSADPGALQDERWFGELSDFVSRMLWPFIEKSDTLEGRSKNCIAELLDDIIAAEQRNISKLSGIADMALVDILPRTSRFDASWVS